MSDTTFVAGTVVTKEWLNDVNDFVYDTTTQLRKGTFIAGTETLVAPATRDAFVVGRNLTGATDCHAFADRTIISGVTDSGTYGVFDATTELQGSHTQDHVYAYQDRVEYAGSGTLANQAGLYSHPSFSGSGTWALRSGARVLDVNKTGAGTLTGNVGVLIDDLKAGTNNVGLNIAQTTGTNDYAIFANGGAKSKHLGRFGIGAEADTSTMLHVEGGSGGSNAAIYVNKTSGWSFYHPGTGKLHNNGEGGFGLQQNIDSVALTIAGETTGPRAYVDTTTTQAFFGATGGDYPIGFVANGAQRIEITGSASSYTLQPGADNTQPLGAAGKRWSVVYAGTGAINTSDAREKEQVRDLSMAEKAVAIRCKSALKAFKFKSSVEQKGEKARIHFGVLAQDIAAAFAAEDLDVENYALFCYDEFPATFDTGGKELTPAGNRYGIRYDELLAFIISTL
jgi:hypothetical protein